MRSPPNFRNLVDERFGRLKVLKRGLNATDGKVQWYCLCDCGSACIVRADSLLRGSCRSCGCLEQESRRKARSHGHTLNKELSAEYRSWRAMKNRCRERTGYTATKYFNRGITICPQWEHSFETFLHDMGAQSAGKPTIERIDNSLGYFPANCRWASYKEQAANRRRVMRNINAIVDGDLEV